jgi:hypothetical protein
VSTPPAQPLHLRFVFLIGAIILFILAALFLFGLGNVKTTTDFGLIAVGLAAYVAAALVP